MERMLHSYGANCNHSSFARFASSRAWKVDIVPVRLSPVEALLVRLGVIPAPMVDFVQHATIRLLLTAHHLGVFAALQQSPAGVAELSARLRVDRAALEPFLDLLRRQGYLRLRAGRYANAPATSRWLIEDSPHSLKGFLGFMEDHVRRWEHFEETIRAGHPPFTAYDYFRAHPERWQPFHDGQRTIASFTVDEVARKAQLSPAARRLIDVGGSHGLYTIALCRRYAHLSATIFDWPEGVAAGQREIARAGMSARIGTVTGNFLTDDLGHGYDVALLGNIIHGQPPEAIVSLLRRVRGALNDGGTLLILDQVKTRQPLLPFAGYVAQLTGFLLLNELGGGIYPYQQVRAWLAQTGYGQVRLRRLLRTPGWVLIKARAVEGHGR